MLADGHGWLDDAARALGPNRDWMLVNLALAAVPLLLSFVLFRRRGGRTQMWWVGLAVFVLFLPNAPYVLTDVLHLIEQIQSRVHPTTVIALVLFPVYLLVILCGLEAYVVSLLNLGSYLRGSGRSRLVPLAEISLHAASAIGIYLGRFERLNSWSVVTELDNFRDTVLDTNLERRPVAVVAVTFLVIYVLYGIAKWLTLAVVAYWPVRHTRPGWSPPSPGPRH